MDKEINMIVGRKTYSDMINFCCDNLILNNSLIEELSKYDIFFDIYCSDLYLKNGGGGNEVDIFQYYLISEKDAQKLKKYTNEIVLYNYDLNIYILCVCHYGTVWTDVPSNWKKFEGIEQ